MQDRVPTTRTKNKIMNKEKHTTSRNKTKNTRQEQEQEQRTTANTKSTFQNNKEKQ